LQGLNSEISEEKGICQGMRAYLEIVDQRMADENFAFEKGSNFRLNLEEWARCNTASD
jgi:hypothetical protein